MSYLIDGKSGKWEVVMGLEVHAQIKSQSKLFSYASTNWGGDPNSQVELVDSGMPELFQLLMNFVLIKQLKPALVLMLKLIKNQFLTEKTIFIQIYLKVIKSPSLITL